jgi:hypothetical protein
MDMINFINVDGILAVTGDYGNWIFCREFIPAEKNSVSDGYWLEKLRISSSQQPSSYDSKETAKELHNRIKELNDEWKETEEEYENDQHNSKYLSLKTKHEETLEYFNDCLNTVDDELDYTYQAYRNMPNYYDYEFPVFEKSLNVWLLIIFDGFDEICNRLDTQGGLSTLKLI